MDSSEVRVEIGKRLKESRLSCRLTQDGLAAMLGLKGATISSWERGKSMPQANEWYQLGLLLGISLDYLVYGVRTVPVDNLAVMGSIFGRPGVQPPAGVFGTPARLQES
jgi:transcriptional regulator with XRE-family HTH domain